MVHVCRRWRTLVFGSPQRLGLKIFCTDRRRVGERLHVWPALPIVISGFCGSTECLDNIKAALEYNDRICRISISILAFCHLKNIFAALERPLPALTELWLSALPLVDDLDPPLVFPDLFKFLGRPVHLQSFILKGISVHRLPDILLSFTNLVILGISSIPDSGYISPEAMITVLIALTKLEKLALTFKSPRYFTHQERQLPPQTRIIIPTLTHFWFKGASNYLEDLIYQIDAPLLNLLEVVFFHQHTLATPHLHQLIRCMSQTMQIPDKAHLEFTDQTVHIEFSSSIFRGDSDALKLGIVYVELERQFPHVAQFCHPPFMPFPTPECLYIGYAPHWQKMRQLDIKNAQWQEFFQSFVTVKNIYLSKQIAPCIVSALQELAGETTTEVLPTLQNIFLEEFQPSGPVHEAIQHFVAARWPSGRDIVISHWDRTE